MNTQSHEQLLKLVTVKMPYGRYKGTLIGDLPVTYLEWFARKGFPQGALGEYLALAHVIRTNGLSHLLEGIKQLNRNS